LPSRLLSKNLKIKIYKTITLSVALYGCETWSLTLREESRLKGVVRIEEGRNAFKLLTERLLQERYLYEGLVVDGRTIL
jgi:hypothetical protein